MKTQAQKVTITVKRPSGLTETVDITESAEKMTKEHFEANHYPKMVEATIAAGKGEIKSYNYQSAEYEKNEAPYGWCEKCQSYCYGDCSN